MLGLPEDASFKQINEAENGESDRVSSTLLLGLNRDASYAEIVAKWQENKNDLHAKIWKQMRQK